METITWKNEDGKENRMTRRKDGSGFVEIFSLDGYLKNSYDVENFDEEKQALVDQGFLR